MEGIFTLKKFFKIYVQFLHFDPDPTTQTNADIPNPAC
jgi:hypothetical protein